MIPIAMASKFKERHIRQAHYYKVYRACMRWCWNEVMNKAAIESERRPAKSTEREGIVS